MVNIIYLIPIDSLGGGVEVAAKGVKDISNPYFDFDVEYICKNTSELFTIKALMRSVKNIYFAKPDVLILSLWRAQFVGCIIKILLPRTKT